MLDCKGLRYREVLRLCRVGALQRLVCCTWPTMRSSVQEGVRQLRQLMSIGNSAKNCTAKLHLTKGHRCQKSDRGRVENEGGRRREEQVGGTRVVDKNKIRALDWFVIEPALSVSSPQQPTRRPLQGLRSSSKFFPDRSKSEKAKTTTCSRSHETRSQCPPTMQYAYCVGFEL
jgi:hypothetical protein